MVFLLFEKRFMIPALKIHHKLARVESKTKTMLPTEMAGAILFFQMRRNLTWMDLMVISSTGLLTSV